MTILDELSARARAVGFCPQELEDALVTSANVEDRESLRVAIRLRPEFSDYIHHCFATVQWCEQKQRRSSLSPEAIIDEAVNRFFDPTHKKSRREFSESLHSGWIRKDWKTFNRLKRQRKVTGSRDPVTATDFDSTFDTRQP